MKAKLFLLVFVVLGAAWALLVTVFAAKNGFALVPYLDAPFAGIAVGTFGGFLIGALGLRMSTKADAQNFIKKMNARSQKLTINGTDPLVPCQVGHREPYFDPKVN